MKSYNIPKTDYRQPTSGRPDSQLSVHSYDYPAHPAYENSASKTVLNTSESHGDIVLPPTRQAKPISKFQLYKVARASSSGNGRCPRAKGSSVAMALLTCIALAALGIALYDLLRPNWNPVAHGQTDDGQLAGTVMSAPVQNIATNNETSTPTSLPKSAEGNPNSTKTVDETPRPFNKTSATTTSGLQVDETPRTTNNMSATTTSGPKTKNRSNCIQATTLSVLGSLAVWAMAVSCHYG